MGLLAYTGTRVFDLCTLAAPAEELKKHPRENSEEREAVEQEYSILMKFIGRWERNLESAVLNARILEWPGGDPLFVPDP